MEADAAGAATCLGVGALCGERIVANDAQLPVTFPGAKRYERRGERRARFSIAKLQSATQEPDVPFGRVVTPPSRKDPRRNETYDSGTGLAGLPCLAHPLADAAAIRWITPARPGPFLL